MENTELSKVESSETIMSKPENLIEPLRSRLLEGVVIPACPLPLDENRQWSSKHQQAITRYYHASGAGGIAVGVHSTQFAIRNPEIGLFEPILDCVSRELDALNSNMLRIAGICGPTEQAIAESETALNFGYRAGLLSLAALKDVQLNRVLDHCRAVADVIPIIGFYLQPAVGGQVFPFSFWREFAEIPNLVGIKIAPFNRYQTWDVVRAVIETGRDDVAVYTGNDDNIIVDLLTPFTGFVNGKPKSRFINGGLLGQWGVWTSRAVAMLESIKHDREQSTISTKWLSENVSLTDANAAVFDAAHRFTGCIPGIMEVLRRVGLSPTNICLDPNEKLSKGQAAELDRVTAAYPQLVDDEFVAKNLSDWLS